MICKTGTLGWWWGAGGEHNEDDRRQGQGSPFNSASQIPRFTPWSGCLRQAASCDGNENNQRAWFQVDLFFLSMLRPFILITADVEYNIWHQETWVLILTLLVTSWASLSKALMSLNFGLLIYQMGIIT